MRTRGGREIQRSELKLSYSDLLTDTLLTRLTSYFWICSEIDRFFYFLIKVQQQIYAIFRENYSGGLQPVGRDQSLV